MNLQILQDNFIDYLYDQEKTDIIFSLKKSNISPEKIFQIYRNNLFSNLTNALKITFPLIYQYLGDEKFNKNAHQYISCNPSKSNNLDNYGQNFCCNESQFLQDLAKFEWYCHLSFLSADSKILSQEDLQKININKLFDLKFKLSKSVFLLQSQYDLLSKRKSDKKQEENINYLIYRHYNIVKTKKISDDDYVFLSEIKNNLTLFEIYNKYEINIGELLAKYINDQILTENNLNKFRNLKN
jgi:hypothetical protein